MCITTIDGMYKSNAKYLSCSKISLQLKRTFALRITKTKNGDNSVQVSLTAEDDLPPLSGTTTSDSEREKQ